MLTTFSRLVNRTRRRADSTMNRAISHCVIKRKLRTFLDLIIKRRVPHTLVSYRFLLPRQSLAVRMHRAVFLGCWGNLPRWLWLVVQIYGCGRWLAYQSWRQMVAAWRRHAVTTRDRFRVPLLQQAVDLCSAALFHGIPPHFYYRYGLFGMPRPKWLNCVFEHELPHWHMVMSGRKVSPSAIHLLSDKKAFAEAMAAASIGAVATQAFLRRGEPVPPGLLFTKQSLFCKPNMANRSRGAFELVYDAQAVRYRLRGEEAVEGEAEILRCFAAKTALEDYILQPLLVNHPEVHEMCGQSRLATIRIVTAHDGRKGVCVGAVLEMPRPDERNLWWLMSVEPKTGELIKPVETSLPVPQERKVAPPDIAGCKLPSWEDAVGLCLRAHELLSEIAAIGWDAAITPAGAVLIEGNFNWRVATLQIFSGIPLLETGITAIYGARLWPRRPFPYC